TKNKEQRTEDKKSIESPLESLFSYNSHQGFDQKSFCALDVEIDDLSLEFLKKFFENAFSASPEEIFLANKPGFVYCRFSVIDVITAKCSLIKAGEMKAEKAEFEFDWLLRKTNALPAYILCGNTLYYFNGNISGKVNYIAKMNEEISALFPKEKWISVAPSRKVLDQLDAIHLEHNPLFVPHRFVHHLIFQPSLPASATPENIKTMEKIFGDDSVVQAEKKLTGIVHYHTERIRQKIVKNQLLELFVELATPEKNERLEILQTKFNERIKKLPAFLLQENLLKLGLSFELIIDLTKKTCRCQWIGRSLMQTRLFNMNEKAYSAFFFNGFKLQVGCGLLRTLENPSEMALEKLKELTQNRPAYILCENRFHYFDGNSIIKAIDVDASKTLSRYFFPSKIQDIENAPISILKEINKEIGHHFKPKFCFYKEGYTSEFKIRRSIPVSEMEFFMRKVKSPLEELLIFFRKDFIIDHNLYPDDFCKIYTQLFEEAQKDLEKMIHFFMYTIYVATGLEERSNPEFWTHLSDMDIILSVLWRADELKITLDLNKIPSEFKEYNIRPLTLAIQMGKLDIFSLFLERGARIDLTDSLAPKGILNYLVTFQDKASDYLENVICAAIALKGESSQFWPGLSSVQIIKNVLDCARESNITLDLNRILIVAINQRNLKAVSILIQNGARIDQPYEVHPDALAYADSFNDPLLQPIINHLVMIRDM
ncbi:MAG TPA: hypothetical protein VN704_10125, partial [Verrucomicrobiae bacterium]|nr:hypothetical protein [Verrucomicrobiae bacterium]